MILPIDKCLSHLIRTRAITLPMHSRWLKLSQIENSHVHFPSYLSHMVVEPSTTSVVRATSPLSRGTLKSKGGGKLSTHFCAGGDTIETFFRTISDNQLSIYGAVSDLFEEYSSCQARTVRLVLAGQSDPLFETARFLMTTPTFLTEVPAQENLLRKYKERVGRLSQQNRVIEICIWQDS